MARWELVTGRLRLRRITRDDADLMLAVWNDPAFLQNVGDRGVRTEDQARREIETGAMQLYAKYGYGPYAIELRSSRERIGICGLFKRDNLDDPDIGFALLPDFCRQGYGEEAAAAVVRHAHEDLGLETLTAIVAPDNAASIRLIEKLGLRFGRMITMPGDEQEICLYDMALGKE